MDSLNGFDYKTRKFRSTESMEAAQIRLQGIVLDVPSSREYFEMKEEINELGSFLRIGDIEAAFLSLPFVSPVEAEAIKGSLWFCGINPEKVPDPAEFAEVLRAAKVLAVQPPLLALTRIGVQQMPLSRIGTLRVLIKDG